ncbi:MAG: MraY family glycosyltransferase [Spirochaetia bacterium]|jgi:UDP-GlcNAc:undecaprenyl-phosphate GlcNAc-1-phosphate transferase|nr:MraY family glycosyltransferase [Spirochaetia bacterium]
MTGAICAFVSFVVSALMLPYIIQLASQHGLFDSTGGRKIHSGKIPRLGGIGIALGWGAGLLATLAVSAFLNPGAVSFPLRFLVVIGAGLIFHAIGLVDDIHALRAYIKFALQCLAALAVVLAGFRFDSIHLPFMVNSIRLGWLAIPLTVFWIVGVANAFNLIDGLDGLAGGIALIIAGVWTLIFFKVGSYLSSYFALALAGATLGFLLYNVPPALVFMGDSGSLFLGFFISVLPLLSMVESGAKNGDSANLLSSMALCIVPIVDTLAAILRRFKRKVSLFAPDRKHVHHILLDLGMSNRRILAILYSSTATLGSIVLIADYLKPTGAIVLKTIGILGFIVLYRRISKAGDSMLKRRDVL